MCSTPTQAGRGGAAGDGAGAPLPAGAGADHPGPGVRLVGFVRADHSAGRSPRPCLPAWPSAVGVYVCGDGLEDCYAALMPESDEARRSPVRVLFSFTARLHATGLGNSPAVPLLPCFQEQEEDRRGRLPSAH